MFKILLILLLMSITLCFESGRQLAETIENRPKPDDIISINKMVLLETH